jgi:hypothetical protein
MRMTAILIVCLCLLGCTRAQEDSPRLTYFNDVRWSWSPETTVFELDKRGYCTAYPDHTHGTRLQVFNAFVDQFKSDGCGKVQGLTWNLLPFFSYEEWGNDQLLSKYQELYWRIIERYRPANTDKVTRSYEAIWQLWSDFVSSSSTLQKINRNIIVFDKVYGVPKAESPILRREFFYSPFYERTYDKGDTLVAHCATIDINLWPKVRADIQAEYGEGKSNTWIDGEHYLVASAGSEVQLWNINLKRLGRYLEQLQSRLK